MFAWLRKLFRMHASDPASPHAHESFRLLVEGVREYAIFMLDPSGHVTTWNAGAERIKGYSAGEIIGQHFSRFYPPEDIATGKPARALEIARGTGKYEEEGWRLRKDGNRFWASVVITALYHPTGAIAGFAKVTRDLTERRQAEEQARQLLVGETSRLAAIVECSEDPIIGEALDGTVLSWNKAAERLYGYTAAEMLGKSLSILLPPGHAEEVPSLIEQLKRGERIEHYRTVRRRKDGSLVDVLLTLSPVRNEHGEMIGASKIVRDITAMVRQEQALRFLAEASKVLSELLDIPSTLRRIATLAVPTFADWCSVEMLEPGGSLQRVAVAHADPAKVALADELYRRYPPERNSPLGAWHILRTAQPELVPDISDSLLRELIKDDEPLRIARELGVRSYMGVPLILRGETRGVLTFVSAESGRRYEAADLQVAQDLAHRAAIAIENSQLYQELRDADRHRSEFLTMLAHELRNPLAPISNGLHLLRLAGNEPGLLEQARTIMERQLNQLVRLVDDLLDVTRITHGKIELRIERINLEDALHSAIETSTPLIQQRGHELTVTPAPEPIFVQGDLVRLSQVFSNLLHNAAKYTEQGGHLWISSESEPPRLPPLSEEDTGRGAAIVRVRDNGMGIPPEMLRHVFEMFTQLDHSLERSHGGLGIGLTVVRRVVEMHGGTVEAHSAGRGQGSEFVVRLPLAPIGIAAPPKPSGNGAGHAMPAGQRILVVDDNEDLASSLAMMLQFLGHEVETVNDGLSALETAPNFHPQVIFLDLGMPRLNGYETAQRIRVHDWGKDLVLIALTGWGQEEDRRRTREAGFDHHVVKPIGLDELRRVLALGRTR